MHQGAEHELVHVLHSILVVGNVVVDIAGCMSHRCCAFLRWLVNEYAVCLMRWSARRKWKLPQVCGIIAAPFQDECIVFPYATLVLV